MKPLLTVIMSTYKESKEKLSLSINSILNQTFSNFKFIIIDDNPTSLSLKRYLKDEASKDKRIELLINKTNMGLVKSLNRGISHADSTLIARMDADDISKSDRFANQIAFMKKYNLDFVFCNSESVSDDGHINHNGTFFDKKIINQNILKYMFSYYNNIALHSTWMLKRKVYITLHGYRNVFAAEDFDFIIRALTYKFKLGYQPNKLFIWRKSKKGISGNNVFGQFISTNILQKYSKRIDYTKIFPVKYINYIRNMINNKLANARFNKFLKQGHNLRIHTNLINLFKFGFVLVKSLTAIKYMIKLLTNPIRKRKILRLINNENIK